MRNYFKYLFTAAALLSVWACEKENKEPKVKDPEPEIKVSGITANITFTADGAPRTFNVKANYDWTISSSEDWLAVSPSSGLADEVVAVTATPLPYESRDPRNAEITIAIPEKDASKLISVTQLGYDGPEKDTHPAGTVFFQDDFNWISTIWPEKLKNSKYGWTSVKLDGTNYNEFSLKNGYDDVDAVFDDKGYTYHDNNST